MSFRTARRTSDRRGGHKNMLKQSTARFCDPLPIAGATSRADLQTPASTTPAAASAAKISLSGSNRRMAERSTRADFVEKLCR